jgi:hypothetical protein
MSREFIVSAVGQGLLRNENEIERHRGLVYRRVAIAILMVPLALLVSCDSKDAPSSRADNTKDAPPHQQPAADSHEKPNADSERRSSLEGPFVALEHQSRIEADEAFLRPPEPGKIVDPRAEEHRAEPRTWRIFVRRDPSPTKRLCLAVCQTEHRYTVLTTIELRQFDSIVYLGNVDVRMHGPAMQLVEVQLPKPMYTDLDSFIEGLKKNQREAIDFQKQHRLPPIETLQSWLPKEGEGMGMMGSPEVDPRRFLYIGSSYDALIK